MFQDAFIILNKINYSKLEACCCYFKLILDLQGSYQGSIITKVGSPIASYLFFGHSERIKECPDGLDGFTTTEMRDRSTSWVQQKCLPTSTHKKAGVTSDTSLVVLVLKFSWCLNILPVYLTHMKCLKESCIISLQMISHD